MKLETLLSHMNEFGGIDDKFSPSHTPIYQTATFDIKTQRGEKIYDYTRTGNPTRESLENIFAKAENGSGATCVNTGIAAVALLFEVTLKANSHILVEQDCYGGTYRLLKIYEDKYNATIHFADFTNIEELKEKINNFDIKLILCESPTNPGLKIINLKQIADLAKENEILFAVDNSVATFASQKPLEMGADFSVFSATKYISGHGSVIAGALVCKSEKHAQMAQYYANAEGRSQNPMDVYVVSLGIPTLPIRLKQHEQTAKIIAEYLTHRDEFVKIRFPGFKSHPQYQLAKEQMKYVPGIITADLNSIELAEKLVAQTRLFGEKASFGTADSRIEIPSKISHATYSETDLAKIGISKSSVRLSIGLEHIDDLLADIEQALK